MSPPRSSEKKGNPIRSCDLHTRGRVSGFSISDHPNTDVRIHVSDDEGSIELWADGNGGWATLSPDQVRDMAIRLLVLANKIVPMGVGVPPATGWYLVPNLGCVWLIRYEPDPEDVEDVDPGPHALWAWGPHDDPEAIEVLGIEPHELRWRVAHGPGGKAFRGARM